jgi:hypothetical protein
MSALNPIAEFSLKEIAREAAHRLWRTILALLVVGIAIAVGWSIPHVIAKYVGLLPAELAPAGVAFGAATVLAVARDLLQTLPTAIDYIVSAVSSSLPRLFAQVAVAALGIGLAWHAVGSDPTSLETKERPLNLNVAGMLPPIVLNEDGSAFTTYLLFGEWQSTIEGDLAQLNQVDALVLALTECIQAEDDTIHLVVRAYASSSGPDLRNLALYKARGAYVADLLGARVQEIASAKQGQFKIEVRDWKSLEVMKLRRLFKDTDSKGIYLKKGGGLNRRADILVRSAGSCLPE